MSKFMIKTSPFKKGRILNLSKIYLGDELIAAVAHFTDGPTGIEHELYKPVAIKGMSKAGQVEDELRQVAFYTQKDAAEQALELYSLSQELKETGPSVDEQIESDRIFFHI